MLSVKLHKSKLYTAVAAVQYKNIKSGTSAAIDELPAIGLRAIHDKKTRGTHRHQTPPRSRTAARCAIHRDAKSTHGHTGHYGQT